MTWRELDDLTTRLAGALPALGLRTGRSHRVADAEPDRRSSSTTSRASRPASSSTPLNYRYAPPEIDHALEVSGAQRAARARRAGRRPRRVAARRAAAPRRRHVRGARATRDRRYESLVSATACRPRSHGDGPERSGRDLLHLGEHRPGEGRHPQPRHARLDGRERGRRVRAHAEDVFLPGSSMSHIGSFLWTLRVALASARVSSSRAPSTPVRSCRSSARTARPSLAMIPAALTALVRDHDVTADDFASLRFCRSGADKVSRELERRVHDARRLPHRRGLRHDRGRARHARTRRRA